jgi:hypothetical protein
MRLAKYIFRTSLRSGAVNLTVPSQLVQRGQEQNAPRPQSNARLRKRAAVCALQMLGEGRVAAWLWVAMAVSLMSSGPATAQMFLDDDGPMLIWVTIKANPGEEMWQACRRVYQRDVYQVAAASRNKVRCRIDHSRIYQPGEIRQNFNRQ